MTWMILNSGSAEPKSEIKCTAKKRIDTKAPIKPLLSFFPIKTIFVVSSISKEAQDSLRYGYLFYWSKCNEIHNVLERLSAATRPLEDIKAQCYFGKIQIINVPKSSGHLFLVKGDYFINILFVFLVPAQKILEVLTIQHSGICTI